MERSEQNKGSSKRRKKRCSFEKLLSDRRQVVSRKMTSLTIAERQALAAGNVQAAESARKRWTDLHISRHLVSPYAEAYRTEAGEIRHVQKSNMVEVLDIADLCRVSSSTLDAVDQAGRSNVLESSLCSFLYDSNVRNIECVMIDVMNCIWKRGMDARGGTTLHLLTVTKMKNTLKPWMVGSRGRHLKELHLHVDDPNLVIPQKACEHHRRDTQRDIFTEGKLENGFILPAPHETLDVSWSALLSNRKARDALANLHLICGAIAAMELCEDEGKQMTVYLHGGCFAFHSSVIGRKAKELVPHVVENVEDRLEETRLESKEEANERPVEAEICHVPRPRVLCFFTASGLQVSGVELKHGESETRFVPSFNELFIRKRREEGETGNNSGSYVFISSDTDVTMILCMAKFFTELHSQGDEGIGVFHVLGNKVLSMNKMRSQAMEQQIDVETLAILYILGGCDFCPGTFGINHSFYLKAYCRHRRYIGNLNGQTDTGIYETLIILSYLWKASFRDMRTSAENEAHSRELQDKVDAGSLSEKDKDKFLRQTTRRTKLQFPL